MSRRLKREKQNKNERTTRAAATPSSQPRASPPPPGWIKPTTEIGAACPTPPFSLSFFLQSSGTQTSLGPLNWCSLARDNITRALFWLKKTHTKKEIRKNIYLLRQGRRKEEHKKKLKPKELKIRGFSKSLVGIWVKDLNPEEIKEVWTTDRPKEMCCPGSWEGGGSKNGGKRSWRAYKQSRAFLKSWTQT